MFRVSLFNVEIGLLDVVKGKRQALHFTYLPGVSAEHFLGPTALYRPDANNEIADAVATQFFRNLLPEGAFRRILAAGKDTDVSLLRALAHECAGAVSLQHMQSPEPTPSYTPLTSEEVVDLFDPAKRDALRSKVRRGRMSQAGEMPKVAMHRDTRGQWLLPSDGARSTWLVKGPRANFPEVGANELICLEMARVFDLPTPEVELLSAQHGVIAVARYDRRVTANGDVAVLHQVDGCQAMGLKPEEKYQDNGNTDNSRLRVTMIQDAMTDMRLSVADRRRWFRWALYNMVIGNNDSHAKNFSFLLSGNQWQLAPHYDMLSTTCYEDLDQKFAYKIGASWHSLHATRNDWLRLAREVGLAEAEAVDELRHVSNALPSAAGFLKSHRHAHQAPRVLAELSERIARVQPKVNQMVYSPRGRTR